MRERETERERATRTKGANISRACFEREPSVQAVSLRGKQCIISNPPSASEAAGVFNSYVFSVRFQRRGSVRFMNRSVFSIVTPAVSCGSHRAVGARLVLPSSPSPRGRGPTWSRRARYPPQPARVVAPPPGARSSKPVEPNPASRTNL